MWLLLFCLVLPSDRGLWFQPDRGPRPRRKKQLGGFLTVLAIAQSRVAGGVLCRGHELGENPFLQQPGGSLRKRQKFHACLSRRIDPGHPSRGFDANTRVSQLETQKNLLVREQRSDRLNR